MKRTLLICLALFLAFERKALSQEQASANVHPQLKKKSSKKTTLPEVKDIAQLLALYQTAKNVEDRAECLFDLTRNYINRLKIDSAFYYSDQIKLIAEAHSNEHCLGKYYLSRASACYYRNKNEEAIGHLNKAVEIFRRYDDLYYLGLSYRQLARQQARLGENKVMVRQNYHLAISLLREHGGEADLQRTYYELGRDYFGTYETDSAAYYVFTSLKMAEKEGNKTKIFNSASLLGHMYLVSGDLDNAGKYLHYGLDVFTPSSGNVQLRTLWGNLAEYYMIREDFGKAGEAISEYGKLNAILGDNWGLIMEMKLKGILSYHKENYPVAVQSLRGAYNRRGEIQTFNYDIKNIAFQLAKAELKAGDLDSAIVHLHVARNIARDLQFVIDEMESDLLLAEGFQSKRKMDSAYYYYKEYAFIKDSILVFQKEKTVMEITAKYDAEKKAQQIIHLQNEQQLYAYQLQLKNKTIEGQQLQDIKKTQQLSLLTQQSQIDQLQASEKALVIANNEKEIAEKQKELNLLEKEKELQSALAARQNQQKNLAFFAIAAITIFGLFAYYRYRQNRNLSRQLTTSLMQLRSAQEQLVKNEKDKEAENVRLRISRDIHDEVGATLSGVALFSEIAKQKMQEQKPEAAREYLEHISENSKEMVEKMSDIIWTINPKNDSFENIIFKLQSYALNCCAGKNIELHFQIDNELKTFMPAMQERKNIYLLVKEAINNAIKYSHAKNIYFTMRQISGEIKIEIRDDGRGFEKNSSTNGNGMANMHARAAELNGLLNIRSEANKGTVVDLRFKFHPFEGQPQAV